MGWRERKKRHAVVMAAARGRGGRPGLIRNRLWSGSETVSPKSELIDGLVKSSYKVLIFQISLVCSASFSVLADDIVAAACLA